MIYICLISLLLCYLATGFVRWNFNPGNWTLDIRVAVLVFTFMLSFFGMICTFTPQTFVWY